MPGMTAAFERAAPEVVIHLAAQAGVRYSLENPRAYADANLTGTFNLLELARAAKVRHLLYASTSSIYGAAAFRFFTVYGPWGRPDMSPWRFAAAIDAGQPIEIYGDPEHIWRDFTYVDDLVEAVVRLMDRPPAKGQPVGPTDSLSPVAPWRVVNIGRGEPAKLDDLIAAIEAALGKPAERRQLPMQAGDVPLTFASSALLRALTGYRPATPLNEGVTKFCDWFRHHTIANGAAS
jgi:UDP-glucuronate 4-epimerase